MNTRYAITFFACAAASIIGVIAWLTAIVPHGEGAFGIATAVPFILLVFPPAIFCLIWFPANLMVFLWHRRAAQAEPFQAGPYMLLIISGGLFAIVLFALACRFVPMWLQRHASVIQTNAPAGNPGAATVVANVPKAPPESKADRMREVLSTYNDVPIDFYGKLEDQFGNPAAGAELKGSMRVISGVRQGTDWLTTTSDANGLFQFHGNGQDISTMPSKKGSKGVNAFVHSSASAKSP